MMLKRSYNKHRPRDVPQEAKDAWARHRKPGYVGLLARHFGISRAAISKWPHVPEDRVDEVAALLGLTRTDLRPDLGRPYLSAPPLNEYLNQTIKGT